MLLKDESAAEIAVVVGVGGTPIKCIYELVKAPINNINENLFQYEYVL